MSIWEKQEREREKETRSIEFFRSDQSSVPLFLTLSSPKEHASETWTSHFRPVLA